MMWAFGNYDPIKGEDNMKQFVINSKKIQSEIMTACYSCKDNDVKLDAAGIVVDDDSIVDLDSDS